MGKQFIKSYCPEYDHQIEFRQKSVSACGRELCCLRLSKDCTFTFWKWTFDALSTANVCKFFHFMLNFITLLCVEACWKSWSGYILPNQRTSLVKKILLLQLKHSDLCFRDIVIFTMYHNINEMTFKIPKWNKVQTRCKISFCSNLV